MTRIGQHAAFHPTTDETDVTDRAEHYSPKVERVVLNALAKESRLCRQTFARSANHSSSSSEKPIHLLDGTRPQLARRGEGALSKFYREAAIICVFGDRHSSRSESSIHLTVDRT